MKRTLIMAVSITGLALASAARAETSKDPMSVVKGLVDTIKEFERPEEGQALTSIQKEKNERISAKAHAALDVEGLAVRCLGKTWEGLDPKERKAFVDLLKTLFAEVAYPQSAKFFGSLDLEFDDGGERKGQRVIELAVSHPDEGLIDIEFFLAKVKGDFRIQDIHLDGVSLARDIRSQMQKIIADDSYAELKTRMKKKLSDEGVSSAKD